MHQVIVDSRHRLDQLLARRHGFVFQLRWNFNSFVFGALGLVFPDQALHRNQIDDAFKFVFFSDGNLQRDGICAQAADD
jgi:hypothetical protein